tara:strand:+ start:1594 stop:2583 length:990 start_codon:yes stop_codon:yes gene_type:complete
MPWLTGSKLGFGVRSTDSGPPPLQITGGTTATYTLPHGSYTTHTFTSSGTLVITGGDGGTIDDVAFLLVGGGGGGGLGNANEGGGGGGAGGVVKHPGTFSISGPGSYAVTIGFGGNGGNQPGPGPGGDPSGAPGDNGNNGADTTFVASPTVTYTAKGGGAGSFHGPGNPGGCGGGGGGAGTENPGGTSTQPPQSNPGASEYGTSGGMGIHMTPAGQAGSGNGAGGGGAGGAGEDGSDRPGGPSGQSCNDLGGAGITIDYRTGSGATYAHGGNGGGAYNFQCIVSHGGATTGDGGGGANPNNNPTGVVNKGGSGGAGICVFRFPNTVYNG